MFAKMGVVAAAFALALSGCIGEDVTSIAGPQEGTASLNRPNPARQLEILYPYDGMRLYCGHCIHVTWRVRGAEGDVTSKVEAWYDKKRVVLGNDLLNHSSFEWQLPGVAVKDVRLRVSAKDARGMIGSSQLVVSILVPSRDRFRSIHELAP